MWISKKKYEELVGRIEVIDVDCQVKLTHFYV